jgi:transcriptional regulator with XRE-family HTH domain
MPIGERIAIYRRRRGLTQLVLAGLIGRSESWLSQVERGIRPIDRLSVLIDIAHVLKVNVTDLTGQPFSLAPNGSFENDAVHAIRHALTRYDVIPAILDPLMTSMRQHPTSRACSVTSSEPGSSGKRPATRSSATCSPG